LINSDVNQVLVELFLFHN